MTYNEIAASNIALGDIFYVQVDKRYYFLQVIHITENVANLYGEQYQFGYFVVVLKQSFSVLPSTVDEIDLTSIYQPQYIWKKTLFYFGLWNQEPNIRFDASLMHYHYKDQYALTKFGNAPVTEKFKPTIEQQFSVPAIVVENEQSVQISPTPLSIQMLIWALEEESKGKTKKCNTIMPRFFKQWLEYVEPDYIIKAEKIVTRFESINTQDNVELALKKAVLAINKLEQKYNFIATVESENLVDQLIEISTTKKLSQQQAESIINANRDW